MMTFFTVCAVVGVVVMVAQLGLTLFGLDGDHSDISDIGDDLEMGDDYVDGHHGGTDFFNILSFRSLVAFFAFFGLVGRLALRSELAAYLAILLAVSAGVAAMFIVAYVMRLLHSLQHDGSLKMDRCIGRPGKVNLSIPARGQGRGKVMVLVSDQELEFDAVTDSPEDLPSGTQVLVVGLGDDNSLEVQAEPNLNAIEVDV